MARFNHLPFIASLSLVAACSQISDEQRYFLAQDWNRLTTLDVTPDWDEERATWQNDNPLASTREAVAERQICLHTNGENRVMFQDGISDRVDYRRCALSPYPDSAPGAAAPGQRLRNRPDDLAPQASNSTNILIPVFTN